MDSNLQDTSLYVHIPFCTQRCSYCDFYFVTTKHGQSEFIESVCQEIHQVAQNFPHTSVSTIYFGGGTPSRLSPGSIGRILEQIHTCFTTHQVLEITLEANPEDITAQGLEELIHAGITRISLGVQSFQDADLKFMNRCHSAEQAVQACDLIHSAGLASWSLDLIFGIPGASPQSWQKNLHLATETGVPHISAYSLTIEPYTPLHKQVKKGIVKPVSDEETLDQFQQAMEILQSDGFDHYEISSYARSGHHSEHNSRYWNHTNYLGFGPSSHSFWWQNDTAFRWENVRNLKTYSKTLAVRKSPVSHQEILSDHDLVREKIMLGLRTSEGLNLNELLKRYRFDLVKHKHQELATLKSRQLIFQRGANLHLSMKGMRVCDRVTAHLWPDQTDLVSPNPVET